MGQRTLSLSPFAKNSLFMRYCFLVFSVIQCVHPAGSHSETSPLSRLRRTGGEAFTALLKNWSAGRRRTSPPTNTKQVQAKNSLLSRIEDGEKSVFCPSRCVKKQHGFSQCIMRIRRGRRPRRPGMKSSTFRPRKSILPSANS